EAAAPNAVFQQMMQIVEGHEGDDTPALAPRPAALRDQIIDIVGMRGAQGDVMAATMGTDGDRRPRTTGEDIGNAATPVDGYERIPGRHEDPHRCIPECPT